MKVQVAAGSDGGDAINAFYQWLRADVDVVRSASVTLDDRTTGDGRMGALDIVNVVLANGAAFGSLAVAYASWRQSRPEPPATAPALRFTRGDMTVEVRDASPETIERLVKLLSDGEDPA